MRQENERPGRLDRRRFLTGAGLALGAASTVTATSTAAVAIDDTSEPQHKGYRETELVKTYYRAARY